LIKEEKNTFDKTGALWADAFGCRHQFHDLVPDLFTWIGGIR